MDRITTVPELTAAIDAARLAGRRSIVGIVGPPGAGKTHLARFLHDYVAATSGTHAVRVVPMDGFHLRNDVLGRLGRRSRKGAPDTFDVAGFVELLDQLRVADSTVRAPTFSRALDEPVADTVVVGPDVEVVLVEGNYLLVEHGPWAAVADRLDVTFYVDTPDDVRRGRLLARHELSHGSRAAAERWIDVVDAPNSVVVETTRPRADHVVALIDLPGPPLW